MPFSAGDRFPMSRLRLDARVLSTDPPAPDRRVQAQSAHDADAAVHRLRLSGIHPECRDRATSAACFHSASLSLGLARAPDLLLDLSQHALVSVRVLRVFLRD